MGTTEQQINALNANIDTLKSENIPNAQSDLQNKKEQANGLDEQVNKNTNLMKDLAVECEELATEKDALSKQLEDVKIAEDKKRTENEHLKQDIADLKKRIADAKEKKRLEEEEERRLEQQRLQRLDREKAEKERLKKEEEEQKTEEKMDDIRVDAPIKQESSDFDAKSPLVTKENTKGPESACCCVVL